MDLEFEISKQSMVRLAYHNEKENINQQNIVTEEKRGGEGKEINMLNDVLKVAKIERRQREEQEALATVANQYKTRADLKK
jgi:hypothetical protein